MLEINPTKFLDVFVLRPRSFQDDRGFFMESYNKNRFDSHGIEFNLLQDNHSFSKDKYTLRGLHYQLNPMAQTKIVRVLVGEIYDVIVDIRKGSPTFGEWMGVNLSGENKKQLVVPKGFAHAFITLVPDTHVFYKVDNYYSVTHDRGIAWDDPELAIDWPVDIPMLSEKDSKHPRLADAENNFEYTELINDDR